MFFNVGFIGLSRGHNVVVCVMADKKTAHFVVYRLVEGVFNRTGHYIQTNQEGKSIKDKAIVVTAEETDVTKERCHRVVRVASTPQEHALLHDFNKWYYSDTFNDLAKLTADIKKVEVRLQENSDTSLPTNVANDLLYKLSEITHRLNFLEQKIENIMQDKKSEQLPLEELF